MATLDALKAVYEAQIAKLTDPFLVADANSLLEEFIALKTTAASLQSQSLDSYSIAQRSITRRKLADVEEAANIKRVDLHRCIFGSSAQMYVESTELTTE